MSTIKKTGEWVMLTKTLPVKVPIFKLGIYYAKPVRSLMTFARTDLGRMEIGARATRFRWSDSLEKYEELICKFISGDKIPSCAEEDVEFEVSKHEYDESDIGSMVEIITPFFPVRVWPEEYNVVGLDYALNLVENESHVMRYLDNNGAVNSRMKNVKAKDKLFYLQSRGLSFRTALKTISGEITSQHLFYFDPRPQYVEMFQREYLNLAEKYSDYCKDNGLDQLLYFHKSSDDSDYYLSEYIEHLKPLHNDTKS